MGVPGRRGESTGGGSLTRPLLLVAVGVLAVLGLAQLGGRGASETPTPAPARPAAAATVDAAAASAEARQFFSDNYSGTSWYPLIQSLAVERAQLVVTTNIDGDAEGKQAAQPICGAARAFVAMNHHGVRSLLVMGQSDRWLCIS